jgi:peptide/nickel transport system substrate-binding protein
VLRRALWGLSTLGAFGAVACGEESRPARSVVFATGADLQTVNPLVTIHPFAKQVERYVLLTTLARYDAALTPQPYLARSWRWSPDHRTLTFTIASGVRWSDGKPTIARDVAWTLSTARDVATGYPRLDDLSGIAFVNDLNDSTVAVRYATPQTGFPDVFTDLAILPAHLLDTVPPNRMRQASWNAHPVGNGPFRFVLHDANRRWVFEANREFPAALGGPPWLDRFVVAVIDEPGTKLAALTASEVDFAGIQPAHAAFVRRDPKLVLLTYPVLLPYGIVFNMRREPFNDGRVRLATALAVDRREIVNGYLYGFGTPAYGPLPPDVGIVAPIRPIPTAPDSSRKLLGDRQIAFELLTVGSGEAPLEQMLQAQLARAGFEVAIRQVELTAFLDRVYGPRHDFQAAVLGVQGDLGLGYLQTLARISGLPVRADPAIAVRIFRDSLPVAFLYHARGVQGMNRRVQGVRMDLRGELPTLVHWWTVP